MTDIKPRRIIIKPQPKILSLDEQRKLELNQLETRYKSTFQQVSEDEKETVIQFSIIPSDPDFPFDVASVAIQLHVPTSYPTQPCACQLLNIPREIATQVENGYDAQFKSTRQTLVKQMNWLDRHMETFFKQEATCMEQLSLKTAQLKIEPEEKKAPEVKKKKPFKKGKKTKVNFPKVTKKEIMDAEKTRKPEFKQLESRFTDTGFKIIRATPWETVATFNLKIHDPKFDIIRGKKVSIEYHISVYYPIVPCTIAIKSDTLDPSVADAIASEFNEHVRDHNMTLSDNMTWLSKNISQLIPTEGSHHRVEIRTTGHDLDNIQCTQLLLGTRCDQCKSVVEIQPDNSTHCPTCSSSVTADFIQVPKTIGMIDTKGCTVTDIIECRLKGRCKTCKVEMKDAIEYKSPVSIECLLCQTKITVGLILVK